MSKRKGLTASLLAIGLVGGVVVLDLLWQQSGTKLSLRERLQPPAWMEGGSWTHPLGTDQLGRDEVARLLSSGWVSLSTGLAVVIVAGAIGTAIGMFSALRRGWVETFCMRVTEAAFAFPGLLIAVVVMSALGPNQLTMILVLTSIGWMGFARVSHDLTAELRGRAFVKAAQGLGLKEARVLLRHVLPNEADALLTVAVLEFARVVLAESSLSYLGMGIQPPASSWGLMVADGQALVGTAWWLVTWPGLAIAFTVLLVNRTGRALRGETRAERPTAFRWRQHRAALTTSDTPSQVATTADRDIVLEVKGLTVDYPATAGSTRALDDVGFQLTRGRTLGIVGESGSGKSTLGLALIGLLPPSANLVSGALTWTRTAPTEGAPARRRFAMIFQDPSKSLNPLMPVGDQITEGLVQGRGLTQRDAVPRMRELLDFVGLPSDRRFGKKLPYELSGGMRQRVMIAIAVGLEPEVLIADEPTSALDVTIQAQILDLIRDIQDRLSMSVLLITHDFGVVAGSCDEVLVLHRGQAVEHGTVDQVLSKPQDPYTQQLIACVPRLDRKTDRLTVAESVFDTTRWGV